MTYWGGWISFSPEDEAWLRGQVATLELEGPAAESGHVTAQVTMTTEQLEGLDKWWGEKAIWGLSLMGEGSKGERHTDLARDVERTRREYEGGKGE